MNKAVKVGIVGASGYSGEELVRLMLVHPHAQLTTGVGGLHRLDGADIVNDAGEHYFDSSA